MDRIDKAPIFNLNPNAQEVKDFRSFQAPAQGSASSDPFDELLSREMGENSPSAINSPEATWEGDYKTKLASMSVDDLKREREKVTEEINLAVQSGNIALLKEAQKKYDLITQTIREKVFSEVHLAEKEEKGQVTVAKATEPSPDDIRKQLQNMDIVVPKDQETPPTVPAQAEKIYAEPSVYTEGENTGSNVQIMDIPNTVSQTTYPMGMGMGGVSPSASAMAGTNANPLTMNTLPGNLNLNANLMGMSSLNSLYQSGMLASLQLNQLMQSLTGGNMGMGGFGLLGQNGQWGDIYRSLFVSGTMMPQTMADLGAIASLKGLFSTDSDKE